MTSRVLVSPKDLARTYDGGYYDDTWKIVEQYRDVLEYKSRHPNKGSSAIAGALEIPRGRIRTWLDGGAPDAARGIETARECGWLEVEIREPMAEALNALVANVFSSGSIAEAWYQPSFALDPTRRHLHITDALDAVGVEYEIVDDRDGRTDEARPSEDASVLGRVLAVLGAPVGPKAEQWLELPAYLDEAPDSMRETFVLCYLENRATEPHNDTVSFREERNDAYLRDLAGLIADVADAPVRVSEKNVILSQAATESLGFV
ncbi:hypothetical protein [Halovivax limisalsi]|uniref:hypothetical protein n=1 Tax=Halovivax limisalsi TaxID=1453760 RepID=UPI001FFC486F|nr:hypothetical protein [Halovivax limisalsi]